MEKKAEAYAKYNKAAVAEMMIKVLPEIASKIAEPLAQIDKITIIGGDGGEQREQEEKKSFHRSGFRKAILNKFSQFLRQFIQRIHHL